MRLLERCFELAKKGNTSPNPMVGCVIVKDDVVVAEGYHHKAGEDHAEIDALKKIGFKAEGCTLYVNLEPCSHTGRTGPCVDAIIKAGVKRVVVGMQDPNPEVSGRGIEKLRQAGMHVDVEDSPYATTLNEFHCKYMKSRMPFVALKYAMSIDGKIATASGDSKWISNEESRKFVHDLRGKYDAIMVGINTVLNDDPQLTCRSGGKDPLRVILDSRLRIPLRSRVLKDDNIIVATTESCDPEKKRSLEQQGIKVLIVNKEGPVSVKQLMERLAQQEIISVLIEGGGKLNAAALREGVVDKVFCFIAPKIVGGKEISAVADMGVTAMTNALQLGDVTITQLGDNALFTGYFRQS